MIKSPTPTKKDVVTVIRQHQANIKAFGVKRLGLFGSFVRNEQTGDSDIDLLVEFEAGQKTFDNFMQLSFFLEEQFNRPVELVTVESVSPYLRPHITQEVEDVTFSA
ncbi:MAG: nucleotidyltransferase family protein [Anaerolineaceae bacterium]|nr:nucleotidyltransferase family protein [Anaerolineaceae bacterium]